MGTKIYDADYPFWGQFGHGSSSEAVNGANYYEPAGQRTCKLRYKQRITQATPSSLIGVDAPGKSYGQITLAGVMKDSYYWDIGTWLEFSTKDIGCYEEQVQGVWYTKCKSGPTCPLCVGQFNPRDGKCDFQISNMMSGGAITTVVLNYAPQQDSDASLATYNSIPMDADTRFPIVGLDTSKLLYANGNSKGPSGVDSSAGEPWLTDVEQTWEYLLSFCDIKILNNNPTPYTTKFIMREFQIDSTRGFPWVNAFGKINGLTPCKQSSGNCEASQSKV